MMLLSDCQNGLSDKYCDIAEPIYLQKDDKLTPDTARSILIHDDRGRALCSWPFTV